MSQSSRTLLGLAAAPRRRRRRRWLRLEGRLPEGPGRPAQKQDHDERSSPPRSRASDGGAPPAEFTHAHRDLGRQTTQLERARRGVAHRRPVKAKADRLVVDAHRQPAADRRSSRRPWRRTPTRRRSSATASTQPHLRGGGRRRGQRRAPATVKLVGGVENTFDGSIYVRRNDEKPVYTAEGGVRFAMAKTHLRPARQAALRGGRAQGAEDRR